MGAVGYWGLIFFALVFIIAGYIFLQLNLYRIKNWKKSKAVVIEHEEISDENGSVYGAVVRFKVKNEHFVSRTDIHSRFPKAIGKRIEIFYDPEDPEKYLLRSFLSLYAAPCSFLAVGVVLVGLVVYSFLTANL